MTQCPPQAARLLDGLLPEQRRVVTTLDRPIFVAAGAGSGKTFTLTRRIVWALSPGSGPDGEPFLTSVDQALVITFTDKAAGEIKERVRAALRAAGMAEEALKVDSAWISTIHHMCARILRTHALDLGIDPKFSMVGEQQASLLWNQALENALAELEGDPGLSALFSEFGAGVGRTGASEVAGLVATLCTKAATAEFGLDSLSFVAASVDVSAVMRALTDAYEALCACDTKYADELQSCQAALDELRGFCELAPGARTAEVASALLEGLYRPNGKNWRAKATKTFWSEAVAALNAAKGEIALMRAQALEEPLVRLTRCTLALYAEAKRARRVLDNDDLLQLTAQALREHPDIAARYASRFRLVMVDEFQDTNTQQVRMVEGLSGEGARRLATVGDAQQAIYGFRGADVSVFERRGAEVEDSATVRLDRNFRSDDAILRFVARVCGDTTIVPDFMDLKAQPGRMSAFPADSHPRVAVELTRRHRLGRASVPGELHVRVAAAQLADRLARIRDAGVAPHDMAVLMRSLNDADIYIEALRERGIEGVVAGGSTFARSPEVRCVLALVRTLANPKDTQSGLFPVLESGMFSLDANDLLILATKPQELLDAPAKRRIYPGAREDVPDFGGAPVSERLTAARRVLSRAWRRVGVLSVADVCLMALRESGWLARLEAGGVAGRATAANLLAAVRHVRELAEPECLDAQRAADEFSRWLDVAKEGPATLSGEGLDAVSLMTAHASKGLEFKVVAVVGCCGSTARRARRLLSLRDEDRVLLSLAPQGFTCPDLKEDTPVTPQECTSPLEWRRLMEDERVEADLREDGRLLYVALTRAQECVVLALDASVSKDGSMSPAMTARVADSLFAEPPCAGEGPFAYGGAEPGLVRCVDLSPLEDGSVAVESGDTLAPCTATLACAAVGGAPQAPGASKPHEPPALFSLPDAEFDASTPAELSLWRPREGVYSYSSAHRAFAALAESLEGEVASAPPFVFDEALSLPVSEPAREDEALDYTSDPLDSAEPARQTWPAPGELEEGAQDAADDADRATSLGSAFHELARYLVETGHAPSPERVEVVAGTYHVVRRDRARLREALARWEDSDVRREALDHALVRSEVPFFCEAPSSLGRHLEGAIDLLATESQPSAALASGARPCALLIDYKTGDRNLTRAQIRVRHELQARFYAYVLRRMGYGDIDCAFVCVEVADDGGQPLVVRYRFR